MTRNKIYDIVSEKIISMLEEGVIPWRKPWKCTGRPSNLKTKKAYRGINILLLSIHDYASPYWLTFKQCRDLKGSIKAGSKGTPIVLWKPIVIEEEEVDDNGDVITDKKVRFLLRYYTVFNTEQCTGLEDKIPVSDDDRIFKPIEKAEQIIDGFSDKPTIRHGGDRAYYSQTEDYVNLPTRNSFTSDEGLYATLFHELIHSTGHLDRLNKLAERIKK